MAEKSLIQIAYEFIADNNDSVTFASLWEHVMKESGLTKEEADKKVGQFFTNLMLDGRFVALEENTWDLRSRHTFDKVHIDMKDFYNDDDSSSDDEEEKSEEIEYNKAFEEHSDTDEEAEDSENSEDSEEETY